ncbi:MAG: monofunctional biosynthetic peptidoglycan transglycosylase [Syntrophales bacterium]|nr:monofunctional biosynthetic peptidoglycan transglycosylase [Syntrophales bacterium]
MVKRAFLWFLIFLILGSFFDILYSGFVPDVNALKKKSPVKTSFMRFREEQWRNEGKNLKIKQQWVPLNRISPYLIKAVIIAEDDKFWKHEGFDFAAIQMALEKDIRKKAFVAGGSTISQQLAKNLYLTPSKNPIRKIKEAILTWRLERALSKRRIIEIYLNVVEWGEGIFGVEMAARNYFGKSAAELTPWESAKLAAVLPNPLKYSPTKDSSFVLRRAERIYAIMVRRGIVIPEYEETIQEVREEKTVDSYESKEKNVGDGEERMEKTSIDKERRGFVPSSQSLGQESK